MFALRRNAADNPETCLGESCKWACDGEVDLRMMRDDPGLSILTDFASNTECLV